MKPYARFIGWQEGMGKAFALFNVEGDHVRAHSTVCAGTLAVLKIPAPVFPTFKRWKEIQRKKALDNVAFGGYTQ